MTAALLTLMILAAGGAVWLVGRRRRRRIAAAVALPAFRRRPDNRTARVVNRLQLVTEQLERAAGRLEQRLNDTPDTPTGTTPTDTPADRPEER